MLDFFLDPEYWRGAYVFFISLYQSGYNMIPQFGWRQAAEAWAYNRLEK